MRLGLLSDVHANLAALEAVLARLDEERVDGLLCAGDLVGYGPQPDACVAALAAAGVRSVAGNHDLIALGQLGLERTDALARTTLEWTRTALAPASREALRALPGLRDEGDVVVAHGALGDPQRYVRAPVEEVEQLERLRREHPAAQVLVLGHTHVARVHGTLGEGPVLVNPGSVGQARERRARARCAVLDLGRGTVELLALRYDVARTRRELVAAGLPKGAHHRRPPLRALLRGRA